MIFEILIATSNPAKEKEIKDVVQKKIPRESDLKIFSLKDFADPPKAKEDGSDFIENAFLKAKFYAEFFQKPTIADDGGLIIPYLNNEPGVKSRRWLGYEMSDEELIDVTLEKMKQAKNEERKAYLKTVAGFYDPNLKIFLFAEAQISGYIANEKHPLLIPGYPFRSIFKIEGLDKYYVEILPEEDEKINHRRQAHSLLVDKILKIYKNEI